MKFLIDTSSLSALVRYYIPFDKSDALKTLIHEKINSGDIILLDKVAFEASLVKSGAVVKALEFIKEKKLHTKTEHLLPFPKFFNMLDNELANHLQKSKLEEHEFEQEKNKYLETADAKFILYLLNEQKMLGIDETILITEETPSDNDSKPFKKLPTICKIKGFKYGNIVDLFKEHFKIKLSEYVE
jgi:thymidylate kinase